VEEGVRSYNQVSVSTSLIFIKEREHFLKMCF